MSSQKRSMFLSEYAHIIGFPRTGAKKASTYQLNKKLMTLWLCSPVSVEMIMSNTNDLVYVGKCVLIIFLAFTYVSYYERRMKKQIKENYLDKVHERRTRQIERVNNEARRESEWV